MMEDGGGWWRMVEDGGWMIVGEMMEGRSYDTKRGILMRNC